MPRYPIDRATNFIVEEESWTVIEYDHTSVPGTIYLSLTENKINLIYDDVENRIADTDRRAKYEVILPQTIQHFAIGEDINLIYSLSKNGKVFQPEEVIYTSSNPLIVKVENNKLIAKKEGSAEIILNLKNYTDVEPTVLKVPIEITNVENNFSFYIEGQNYIRVGRDETYKFISVTGELLDASLIEISNENCIKKYEYDSNSKICTIFANDKNIIEDFTITVTVNYNGIEYTAEKSISILPLW